MKIIFYLLLIFFTQFSFSQSDVFINGKIVDTDNKPIAGIEVINLVNEKNVISDQSGEFNIKINPDDMLVFSSNLYEYKRKSIDQNDIDTNCLIIRMNKNPVLLKDVVVYNYTNINAISLGIVSSNIRSFSPAERRLLVANRANAAGNLDGTAGASVSADGLINFFSGRTKYLKQQLEVEQKEKMLARLNSFYDKSFYTDKLKINSELVSAFQYFVIEDKEFTNYYTANNKTAFKFRIIELSEIFNKLQDDKN